LIQLEYQSSCSVESDLASAWRIDHFDRDIIQLTHVDNLSNPIHQLEQSIKNNRQGPKYPFETAVVDVRNIDINILLESVQMQIGGDTVDETWPRSRATAGSVLVLH
jgi:hypothetical protein